MNPLVCTRCGARVTPAAPLVCEDCGHAQEFVGQPLYCLAGPSGTGKSTVGHALLPRLTDRFVVLEQDVLWVPELRDPTEHHRGFRTTWLRLAATIGQSGRPVLLCGTVVPPELEPLPERALFREVHYLALTCRADVLAARLRARPAWREWDEPRIVEMLEYAAWLERNAATLEPPVELFDTTERSIEETAAAVYGWLTAHVALRSRRGTPTSNERHSRLDRQLRPATMRQLDALVDTLVDDASAGQYTSALPILQRLGMPAPFTRTIVAAHGPEVGAQRQSDLANRQAAREAGMAPNVAGQPGQPRREADDRNGRSHGANPCPRHSGNW